MYATFHFVDQSGVLVWWMILGCNLARSFVPLEHLVPKSEGSVATENKISEKDLCVHVSCNLLGEWCHFKNSKPCILYEAFASTFKTAIVTHTFVCELLYWSFWVWRVTVSVVLQMSKIVIMKKIASFVGMRVAAHNIIGKVTVSVWNFRSSLVHSLLLLKIIHLDGLGFLPLHCFWYPEAILSYIHERCDLWGWKLEVKGVTSPSTSYSDTRTVLVNSH